MRYTFIRMNASIPHEVAYLKSVTVNHRLRCLPVPWRKPWALPTTMTETTTWGRALLIKSVRRPIDCMYIHICYAMRKGTFRPCTSAEYSARAAAALHVWRASKRPPHARYTLVCRVRFFHKDHDPTYLRFILPAAPKLTRRHSSWRIA